MSKSSAIVRFAPSPTGKLHIGNLRTALYNWLFASQSGGEFILRLDDTDTNRATTEFADAIIEDLDWLGLHHDHLHRQSERIAQYEKVANKLKEQGLLYPCYESQEQIDRRRKQLMSRGKPPVYDRAALKLTDEEKKSLESDGIKPHWRFLLPNFTDSPFSPERTEVKWADIMIGEQTVDLASLSDPVLIRADGSYLYTLPSVIDDSEMGVTHVIRGADHITNTGAQIPIFKAIGGSVPNFGHHNLLTDEKGEGLSKRSSSLSLESLRESGIDSMPLNTLAVLIGTAHSVEPFPDLQSLGETFDPSKVSKSPAQFRLSELEGLNERYLHQLDYSRAKPKLESLGISDPTEDFWYAVRPNISKLSEVSNWHNIIYSFTSAPTADEDKDYITISHTILSSLDWSDDSSQVWKVWTTKLQEQTVARARNYICLFAEH